MKKVSSFKGQVSSGAKGRRTVGYWLVAEFCGHDIFNGWHLYLRDSPDHQKRNKDGDWGWVRGPVWEWQRKDNCMVEFFTRALGIDLKGDWTCDGDGLKEFVERYPLSGRKIWGEKRGGVKVTRDCRGALKIAGIRFRKPKAEGR